MGMDYYYTSLSLFSGHFSVMYYLITIYKVTPTLYSPPLYYSSLQHILPLNILFYVVIFLCPFMLQCKHHESSNFYPLLWTKTSDNACDIANTHVLNEWINTVSLVILGLKREKSMCLVQLPYFVGKETKALKRKITCSRLTASYLKNKPHLLILSPAPSLPFISGFQIFDFNTWEIFYIKMQYTHKYKHFTEYRAGQK